ncbi:MAG: hypothetical protein EPN79_10885 [Burkholderiaceae bacterium]|nr:MAG: hypothetical protein EPN79_10885 [Burkholderiaceae bacterium]TBR76810.1 MAG: hypothetical protein EPN64_06190 [Burkholderiaceae bacterium]
MINLRFVLIPIAALALAGCAYQKDFQRDAAQTTKAVVTKQQSLVDSIKDSESRREASEDVDKPYIAGDQQPLSRELKMPAELRRSVPVTALFQRGGVDLQTALNEVSDATGLTITATPDALLPPAMFAPRMNSKETSPIMGPARIQLQASHVPLWKLLDDIARQADVSWRPEPSGAEFYRVSTRIFNLEAIPAVATTSATLGRNGSTKDAFESQSKTSFTTKDQNMIDGMRQTIDALLTVSGKAVVNPENQTVVVTDTQSALDRVAKYIEAQNKLMSRRVRVLVEAISVTSTNNNSYGLNWNEVMNTAVNALTVSSPESLVTAAQVGSVGYARNIGKSAGSTAVINALNEVGTVINDSTFPFITTSGRPVTQAIRTTFNYVDQVQATAISSSLISTTAQAPTVTQKEQTVGTFLTLVPTAKPDGTIFLSVSYDQTNAEPLKSFTVGSGASAVTVQQITINGSGVIQEVPIRSGQTVVIGGMETRANSLTQARMGPGLPMALGGSDQGAESKTYTILLATAVVEQGI